jgi:F-type H+-transporting ATPase subunit delta
VIAGAVIERYARAIFELGAETGQLSQLTEQIDAFARAYEQSRDLRIVIENPLVPEEGRDAVLKDIAGRMGVGELAVNAVRLLAQRRRMGALPDIARRLRGLSDERAGVVRARVTSATPLSEDFYVKLAQKLELSTKKKVVVERAQDPSLIGGIVTRVGDNTIDGSLAGRLSALERILMQS